MREHSDEPRPETTESPTPTSARARERERPRHDTQSDEVDDPQICRGMD
jgi:hypothetical protein